jgi:hypothetical protein
VQSELDRPPSSRRNIVEIFRHFLTFIQAVHCFLGNTSSDFISCLTSFLHDNMVAQISIAFWFIGPISAHFQRWTDPLKNGMMADGSGRIRNEATQDNF